MALWPVAAGFMLLKFAYHKWREHEEGPKRVDRERQEVAVPRAEEGAPVPLIFGRCRVRRPLLAWSGDLQFTDVYVNDSTPPAFTTDSDDTPSHRVYALDQLFVVGIGMGSGTTRGNSLSGPKMHRVWLGDAALPGPSALPAVEGASIYYGQNVSRQNQYGGPGRGGGLRGAYYWFGGWTDQSFSTPASRTGDRLTAFGATRIPGLKRQMCVGFNRMVEDSLDDYFSITRLDSGGSVESVPYPQNGFIFGESPSLPMPNFEVSSYGDKLNIVTGAHVFSTFTEGVDFGGGADPAEVIYCVATDPLGKLNIDSARIDTASFTAVSATLKSEGHGYSRVWEDFTDGRTIIEDVLSQIDGTFDEDPTTGKWRLKLIRPDYDPNAIPHITDDNSGNVLGFKSSGHTGLVNQVRVTYEDASDDYKEKSEIAKNPANAVGQDNQVNEVVLDMGGIKSQGVAAQVAARELASRSVPIMSFRIMVSRAFLRVMIGDAVKVTKKNSAIAGLVFRVANVERGTHENGMIALDVISDTFYVWRNQSPKRPDIGLPNPPADILG